MPGSNKMLSPKSSLRPWLLLLTPGTSGTASVNDSGAGGWRGQELGVGAQGDRRQGSPQQVVERSAHCRPASRVDEPQAERRWVWPVALVGSLCFTSLYPVAFDASSFPGFKTAPPKPMLRREVQ